MLNRANGSAASSVLPMTKRPEDIRHTIGKWLFKSPPNRKAIKSWGNVGLNHWMKWVRRNNFRTKSNFGENSLCKQYPNISTCSASLHQTKGQKLTIFLPRVLVCFSHSKSFSSFTLPSRACHTAADLCRRDTGDLCPRLNFNRPFGDDSL